MQGLLGDLILGNLRNGRRKGSLRGFTYELAITGDSRSNLDSLQRPCPSPRPGEQRPFIPLHLGRVARAPLLVTKMPGVFLGHVAKELFQPLAHIFGGLVTQVISEDYPPLPSVSLVEGK